MFVVHLLNNSYLEDSLEAYPISALVDCVNVLVWVYKMVTF